MRKWISRHAPLLWTLMAALSFAKTVVAAADHHPLMVALGAFSAFLAIVNAYYCLDLQHHQRARKLVHCVMDLQDAQHAEAERMIEIHVDQRRIMSLLILDAAEASTKEATGADEASPP